MNWLMRLARSRWGGYVTGWMFARMSFVLPVKRLIETEGLIAFQHPTPAWPVHILIVPKKVIEGVESLGQEDDPLLGEVFSTVQQLVIRLGLKEYRLIVNGGNYQEVKQLHFHLVAGEAFP